MVNNKKYNYKNTINPVRGKASNGVKKISHIIKPGELSLEDWQIILRRQNVKGEKFRIKNVGTEPIFSTFMVTNPQTERNYRVVIRGETPGINYCSCPDFSVNTLGTCKHVEYVLRKLRRQKGARRMLKKGFISEHSSVTLRYGFNRRVAFSIGTGASDQLKKLVNQFFDRDGFLTPWGFEHFDEFVRNANKLHDNVHYHEDAISHIANMRDQKVRTQIVKRMLPQEVQDGIFNNLLKTDLYPYQKKGVLFAVEAGRCLIADDMGLGKTVQAIAASEIMARCLGVEKVLVVCPASLKHQWQEEIERFTNRTLQVIQGLLPKRHSMYKEERFFKITNYDVIHRDIAAIGEWSPDLIILDEAQRIKNWKTRLARSVKRLPSPYAIVLTGTPLENRLEELHSIVQFIDQHYLGPLFRFLHNHQVTDSAGRVVGYHNLNILGESLKPILIRRKKEEVLSQLPERIEKRYLIAMTPEQTSIHEENKEIAARIVSKWRRYKFLSEDDKQRLMRVLQNMRMVSDNTYLVTENTISGKKIDELEVQLQELFEDPNTKVVIFSQWIRMFELVIAMLNANNWKYVWLHGGVPSKDRGDLIKRFRNDPSCRIFLSTEAGGLGLNLQNATSVINLDLPWNPAVLEQRICRVHRIGQRQPVRVINFVSEGSIEQGILSLHQFKRSMFSGVLDGGENEVFMGTTRFNKFMQTVETVTESILDKKEKPSPSELEEALQNAYTARQEVTEETAQEEIEKKVPTPERIFDRDSIRDFLQAGASFLQKISEQFNNVSDKGHSILPEGSFSGIKIDKDPKTGKKSLQILLPDDKTIEKLIRFGKNILDAIKG